MTSQYFNYSIESVLETIKSKFGDNMIYRTFYVEIKVSGPKLIKRAKKRKQAVGSCIFRVLQKKKRLEGLALMSILAADIDIDAWHTMNLLSFSLV